MSFEDRVPNRAKSIEISTIRYFFDMARGVPEVIFLAIGEPDFVLPGRFVDNL